MLLELVDDLLLLGDVGVKDRQADDGIVGAEDRAVEDLERVNTPLIRVLLRQREVLAGEHAVEVSLRSLAELLRANRLEDVRADLNVDLKGLLHSQTMGIV